MTDTTKPCDLPCPKCGSSDIYRMFHAVNSKIEEQYGEDLPASKFTKSNDVWSHTVKADFIRNHCRTCQYDFDVKPQ